LVIYHHQQLRRAIYATQGGTIYLNAASVPRLSKWGSERRRNFRLSAQASVVFKFPRLAGNDFTVVSEQILYQQTTQVVQPA